MAVKILHAADFHLDSPFQALDAKKAAQRRAEQRQLLERLAALANENGVQLLLLAGDLLDSAVSYHETREALLSFTASVRARVFLAPGNHDYYCPGSPYQELAFPDNVTVFRSPAMRSVTLPELNCRVWGAAFAAPRCSSLLRGFQTGKSTLTELMVLHGDALGGEQYNPITEEEIAASGLDYLALGHIHSFGGVRKSGDTCWAYPGCPEGRGFDELGQKGVLMGQVSKGQAALEFVPLGSREYRILRLPLTPEADPLEALRALLPPERAGNICRVILTGEHPGSLPLEQLRDALEDRAFQLELRDETREPRNLWEGCGDDSLRGLFLTRMRRQYDEADEDGKGIITRAVRYGLAALENREAAL